MLKVTRSLMNFITAQLQLGVLILVPCIILVHPVSAQSSTPQPGTSLNCTYIGSRIQCTDRKNCAYPNFDGKYYQYECCDDNGNCEIEETFSNICGQGCLRFGQTPAPAGLPVGAESPLFTVKSIDGDLISLQDLLDNSGKKYVLLVFSSTGCSSCQEFWEGLKLFAENHADLDVILMSEGDETENKTLQEEQGFLFPIVLWDKVVASDYHVPETPYWYLLSKDQQILFSGFADELDFLERIVSAMPS